MKRQRVRQFCRHVAQQHLTRTADADLDRLVLHGESPAAASPTVEDEAEVAREDYARRCQPDPVVAATTHPLTEEDRRREVITITYRTPDFTGTLHAMTENHVYVTYFMNKHTGERVYFNLALLSAQTLTYGVEFSQNKFARVTWRFLYGPSVLLFASGAMVMTGAHGSAIRQKVLDRCIEILQNDCHYESLVVEKSTIENIVIKGTLSFGLCLNLLSNLNPDCVRYTDNFSGAIIKMKRLDSQPLERYEYCEQIADRDRDYVCPERPRKRRRSPSDDEEEQEESRDTSSPSEESPRAHKKRKHGHFSLNDAADIIFDPDTLDEDQLKRMGKKKNITFIAFDKGQLICAGGKTREDAFKACALLMKRFVACRNTLSENVRLEKQLIERRNKK